MVENSLAVRPQGSPLTLDEVRKYISPHATEAEAYIFLRFCIAQKVNPFINEAYLIKYDPKAKAAIALGIQALLKRAASNPQYCGYHSGVIVSAPQNTEAMHLNGSFFPPDHKLVGGWATVYRNDWQAPSYTTVRLAEYDNGRAQWKDKPGTMIEKVALAQALRRTFPEVEALYEAANLSIEMAGEANTLAEIAPPPAESVEELTASLYGAPATPDSPPIVPEHEPLSETPKIATGEAPPEPMSATLFWTQVRQELGKQPADVLTVLGAPLQTWLTGDGSRTIRQAYLLCVQAWA